MNKNKLLKNKVNFKIKIYFRIIMLERFLCIIGLFIFFFFMMKCLIYIYNIMIIEY